MHSQGSRDRSVVPMTHPVYGPGAQRWFPQIGHNILLFISLCSAVNTHPYPESERSIFSSAYLFIKHLLYNGFPMRHDMKNLEKNNCFSFFKFVSNITRN